MWQPETSVPVLSVPWAHVVSTAAEVHAAGAAVIAVAAIPADWRTRASSGFP